MSSFIVIVEAVSNGRFYIDEALKRGYTPLVVFPPLKGEEGDGYAELRQEYAVHYPTGTEVIYACSAEDAMERLRGRDIVCVVTGSEFGVGLTDALAEALGLPGNPVSSSPDRRDKKRMQDALKRAGVRHIRSETVMSVSEALRFREEIGGGRLVLKPRASTGTNGVHFCDTAEQTRFCFDKIMSSSDFFGTENSDVLVQEFIAGTEYIVNTASSNGIHRVTDMWVYNKIAIGEEGNAYDYGRLITRLDPGQSELATYIYDVLDALGFRYGPGHGEVMMGPDGPVLIEIGARPMGGGFSRDLLDECLGHHLVDAALDCYLEPERFEEARLAPYRPRKEFMIKYFISPKDALVRAVPMMAFVRHFPSFVRGNFAEMLGTDRITRTVDLFSAPGNIQLCHEDEAVLMRDYNILRWLEQNAFSLLFEAERGERPPSPAKTGPADLPADMGPDAFVLTDSPEGLPGELTVVTPDTLAGLGGGFGSGLFLVRNAPGMEETLSLFHDFAGKLRPGGKIYVAPESYEGFPYGRMGIELMMRICGVRVELPLYRGGGLLTGTVKQR